MSLIDPANIFRAEIDRDEQETEFGCTEIRRFTPRCMRVFMPMARIRRYVDPKGSLVPIHSCKTRETTCTTSSVVVLHSQGLIKYPTRRQLCGCVSHGVTTDPSPVKVRIRIEPMIPVVGACSAGAVGWNESQRGTLRNRSFHN